MVESNVIYDFMKLIKFLLNDDCELSKDFEPESSWNELFELIKSHNLGVEVFPCIMDNKHLMCTEPKLYERWRSSVIKISAVQMVQTDKMLEMLAIFYESGFEPVVVKGLSIARYYTKPEYRMMSDLDLYANREDYKGIISCLINLGASPDNHELLSPMHMAMICEDGMIIELHKKLHHSRYMRRLNLDEWHQLCFIRAEKVSSNHIEFFCLSAEDALIHTMLHFARHLVHGGANFRQILDVLMIYNANQIKLDYSYYRKMVKSMNLSEFSDIFWTSLGKWFNLDIADFLVGSELCESIILKDSLFNAYSENEIQEQYRLFSFFTSRLPFVVKRNVFKPFIYISEVLVNLYYHKAKFNKSLTLAKKNMIIYDNGMKMLNTLGLS